ncbi:hypothetical protein PMI37_05026 [Pseudomonas sp. GM80]|nr:hypothetical protein PMI37_05026 [Pseudomonas sp. GM80]
MCLHRKTCPRGSALRIEVYFPGSSVPKDYVLRELEAAFEAKDADSVECVQVFAATVPGADSCSILACGQIVSRDELTLIQQRRPE